MIPEIGVVGENPITALDNNTVIIARKVVIVIVALMVVLVTLVVNESADIDKCVCV